MPCNSDYMEPTGKELAIKRTATLIVYALTALGQKVPTDIAHRAANMYGADSATYNSDRTDKPKPTRSADAVVALLCRTVKAMSAEERERVIYNAHNKTARDLADWVEEHEKADRERIAADKAAKRAKALRESAKAKLSREERAALRL